MKLVFFDFLNWDYDVATPFTQPLGGSQSALCYLAAELASRGHNVTILNGVTQPRTVQGVRSLSLNDFTETVTDDCDAVIVLNGPGFLSLQLRPYLVAETKLVLWTQHAPDQLAMQSLSDHPAACDGWDAIVCVSDWHRQMMMDHYALAPSRVLVLRNAIGKPFENLFRNEADLIAAKGQRLVLAYTSTPFRGLDVLLSIFPVIRHEFPEAELQVYSSMQVYQLAEPQDQYRPLYERCRATEGVRYLGSVAQPLLANSLRQATLLSYPNTFPETSCIAVLEAFAAGMSVVTSHLGALPETTQGYATLVPAEDATTNLSGFARRYLAALQETLHERAHDPVAFAAARYEQVETVNNACTWRIRAQEWEVALHRLNNPL